MNILIVKTSSIGDIIQAFPVVEYLKQRFPHASIDWVVEEEYSGLIEMHPQVRQAIRFGSRRWRKKPFSSGLEVKNFFTSLRRKKYDLLFDLQGNIKSSFITAWAKADEKVGFGWKSVPEWPNFFTTHRHIEVDPQSQIQKRYLQVVQGYFQDEKIFVPSGFTAILQPQEQQMLDSLLVDKRRIMVACGSRWRNKMISHDALRSLLSKISEEDDPYFYLIWGNEAEKQEAQDLERLFPGKSQSVGGLTFPLWQALMSEMDLVIAVDSAALALCGTTKTPSLSFFGPSLAQVYKPLGDHHTAWQGKCPYGKKFTTRCPILRSCKTGACIKNRISYPGDRSVLIGQSPSEKDQCEPNSHVESRH